MKKKGKDKDLISGAEFTKISTHPKKHHYNLPSEVIPEDENSDQLKETLVGMEFDIERNESDNIEEISEEMSDEDLEYLLTKEAFFDENYGEEDEDYVIPDEEAKVAEFLKRESNPTP